MNETAPSDLLAPTLADERVAYVVRLAGRAFQSILDQRLAAHGVNYGFWAYLRVLWREQGLSQSELSTRVGLTGPTTHSVIRRMERAGLVEMRPIAKGRTRRAVFLSERGARLREVLEPLAEEVNAMALEGLSPEEVSQLRGVLARICRNLSAPSGAATLRRRRGRSRKL